MCFQRTTAVRLRARAGRPVLHRSGWPARHATGYPVQEDGLGLVEVGPASVAVAGPAAGAAVAQQPQPSLDVRRMPGATPASLRSSHWSNAGDRSSSNKPSRSSTPMARSALRPRARNAGTARADRASADENDTTGCLGRSRAAGLGAVGAWAGRVGCGSAVSVQPAGPDVAERVHEVFASGTSSRCWRARCRCIEQRADLRTGKRR